MAYFSYFNQLIDEKLQELNFSKIENKDSLHLWNIVDGHHKDVREFILKNNGESKGNWKVIDFNKEGLTYTERGKYLAFGKIKGGLISIDKTNGNIVKIMKGDYDKNPPIVIANSFKQFLDSSFNNNFSNEIDEIVNKYYKSFSNTSISSVKWTGYNKPIKNKEIIKEFDTLEGHHKDLASLFTKHNSDFPVDCYIKIGNNVTTWGLINLEKRGFVFEKHGKLLEFADTTSGDPILLDKDTGVIYLLDHESNPNYKYYKIASSLSDLFNKSKPESYYK